MFLKTLSIKGFKSFAEPTTLEFQPGVTVVVGPNGSGKSNVIDAVAWVLGAQGPRQVRSSKMEDVIFAGTSKRQALGRAEVSLTIDNSLGMLNIDFTEVTIRRTLFRGGDSEYALNGVPCRLLDVQELVSDTGVGRQQHVIISQGNLDGVLNARPEDRRAVIEEAAGVLKFRRRKERAERRLEAAEANLTRLGDLVREVRRQLRPLEQQAEAARRHDEWSAELLGLRRFLAGRELDTLTDSLTRSRSLIADLAEQDATVRRQLGALDVEVLEAEAHLRSTGVDDVGAQLTRWERVSERAKSLRSRVADRVVSTERDIARRLDEQGVTRAREELAGLKMQLDAAIADFDNAEVRRVVLDEAEQRLAADRAEARARSLTEVDTGEESAAALAAEVRGELAAVRGALARSGDEVGRLHKRRDELVARITQLATEHDRTSQLALQFHSDTGSAATDRAGAREALDATQSRLDSARRARENAVGEFQSAQARVKALAEAIDQARSRAGVERLSGIAGVVGALVELIDVDAGYETAIETALGEALNAVVVDDADAARRALQHLQAGQTAGAVVALHSVVASGPGVFPAPAGVDRLRPRVRSARSNVAGLLDHLLARAVAVDTWQAALEVAQTHSDLVVVSRDGARFSRSGWRVGASAAGATGAALADAREALVAAEQAAEQSKAAAREIELELITTRNALNQLEADADRTEVERRQAEQGASRAEANLRQVEAEREALSTHLAELELRSERDQARVIELEARLPALEVAEQHVVAGRAERRRVDDELAERTRALAAERAQVGARIAALTERRAGLVARVAWVEERVGQLEADSERASSEAATLQLQLVALGRLATLVDGSVEEASTAVQAARAERMRQTEAARAAVDRLDSLREQRRALERRLVELAEHKQRTELHETEHRVKLENLVDVVRRELDCEPDVARATAAPEVPVGVTHAARARDLDREIRLLGPVNALALEEFSALQERHEFLTSQVDDIRTTRRELVKVIKAVDEEIVEVFGTAFADVAVHYQRLVEMLFPGGSGRLSLVDPHDLLNTGIEIEARPPGKNVRKLSLLSGGERSLVALAFQFAVFKARPSPFYLMDEVEAALDDVNLQRFLGLLEDFRAEAQLLVVTHQKRTMETADAVYGVTMQSGGSSKVVSERVNRGVGRSASADDVAPALS